MFKTPVPFPDPSAALAGAKLNVGMIFSDFLEGRRKTFSADRREAADRKGC
jgi:hypothetical protein